MTDAEFDTTCNELAKTIQAYIDIGPSGEREALLLRMRALGMRPEHVAQFLQLTGEIEADIARGEAATLH